MILGVLPSSILLVAIFPPPGTLLALLLLLTRTASAASFFATTATKSLPLPAKTSLFVGTTRRRIKMLSSAHNNNDDDDGSGGGVGGWTPLDPESVVAAPCLIEQTLCCPQEDGSPQLAKDFEYATAVLEAWKREEEDAEALWNAETLPISYVDPDDGTVLHGHVVRKRRAEKEGDNNKAVGNDVPGVLFFPTAAGSHDLFLLWKAAALVNSGIFSNDDSNDDRGCVVLIADLLSDDTGWGWDTDRTKYSRCRDAVLQREEKTGKRPVLRSRIRAAIRAIATQIDGVDANRLAALGWCFGGYPVLELAQMGTEGISVRGSGGDGDGDDRVHVAVKAMATFHGVFGDDADDGVIEQPEKFGDTPCEVLICHGAEDPFVSDASLERALETLQRCGYVTTSLLQLKEAKHGFSNPAQDFNPSPAFGYDHDAATKSWKQTLALLKRRLSTPKLYSKRMGTPKTHFKLILE